MDKKLDFLNNIKERTFNPNETLAVLKSQIWKLLSWGARNYTQYENQVLFFNVSARRHKGIVVITLAWDDTYTVRFISTQWNEKHKVENVYFDQLVEVIDKHIEYVPMYKDR